MAIASRGISCGILASLILSNQVLYPRETTPIQDITSRPEKIQCPVLVMAGYHDQFLPTEKVLGAARMIPKGELAIIPGVAHQAFLDNFRAVWAGIVPFLHL